MALPIPLHAYTYAEYLAIEEHGLVRHEYIGGEIYAMAGGTPEHAALAAQVLRLIGNQLPAGCRTYSSDLRVRIDARDVTTYPDGTIICGKVETSARDAMAVTNPVLLVEVTSPSTEAYDRGAKLEHYKDLPSVREVLIVAHAAARLTLHRRETDGSWSVIEARMPPAAGLPTALELASIGGSLEVADVYDGS